MELDRVIRVMRNPDGALLLYAQPRVDALNMLMRKDPAMLFALNPLNGIVYPPLVSAAAPMKVAGKRV